MAIVPGWHRGASVATPYRLGFLPFRSSFKKCFGNPVLRQLEKNTKVEKPLLVEAGRHG